MKKILIVEDEPTIAGIYADEFREAGFEVETQMDGQAALDKISRSRFDAVLLDLDLPSVSGVEIIQRVRAQAHVQKLPLLVLTNAYDYKAVEAAWKAGATVCLTKANVSPNQVVAATGKLLAQPAEKAPAPAPAPAPPSAPPSPPQRNEVSFARTDPVFHAKIAKVFAIKSDEVMAAIQTKWRDFQTRTRPEQQIPVLGEFLLKLRMLTGLAAAAEYTHIADMSSALEALIKAICEKPAYLNLSSLRTADLTINFLAFLVKQADKPWPKQADSGRVLIVDDELIARETAAAALKLVNIQSSGTDNAATALTMLNASPYDLILLDVDMPGMTGFELCGRLRALPAHKQTPVIFVTGMSSFENCFQSSLCGGNDLIGKPFLLIELALKSLTYLYRVQLAAKA